MGFSLAWVAIRGKSREEIHQALSITATGTYHEFPEPPTCAGQLPGGWYVVVKDHQGAFDNADEMAKLSSGAEVVTCFVEEHVMVSESTGWRDGKKIWSVLHDSQKKPTHLEAQGEPPPQYPVIRDCLLAKQDAEEDEGEFKVDHLFDIPVDVAESIADFCHEAAETGVLAPGFEVITIPKEPWWKRWFGGH